MTQPNLSPWIEQIITNRSPISLKQDRESDVAIIGGGIAGITTAYFTLKYTTSRVVLLEADRIAYGATGHNAGQLVNAFERPMADLIGEFGQNLTVATKRDLETTWEILDALRAEANITTPLVIVDGVSGCTDISDVLVHLQNIAFSHAHGLAPGQLFLAEDIVLPADVVLQYQGLYTLIPRREVLRRLETNDERYIAVITKKVGCMNSAAFCEELVSYLQQTYPDRFHLFEHSHAQRITLYEDKAKVVVGNYQVLAKRLILCTNGYTNFSITDTQGADIHTKFHQQVYGLVGYMNAYIEPRVRLPAALVFAPLTRDSQKDYFDPAPYIYMTRRDIADAPAIAPKQSLVCIGGPEDILQEMYSETYPFPDSAHTMINDFLQTTYAFPPKKLTYHYTWHGLMGYTHNGVRLIGPEPLNPILMYNLGCNGIGLLTSIYGGQRIAQMLNNEPVEPSLFDPK